MVTEIEVRGFKCLADFRMHLGQVSVLIGANGSGKTTILEAIGVLGAAARGRVDDEAVLRRGVRAGVPALYKSAFRSLPIKPFIHIRASGTVDETTVSYAAGLGNPISKPHSAWEYRTERLEWDGRGLGRGPHGERRDPYSGIIPEYRASENACAPVLTFLDTLADYALYAMHTPALSSRVPDPQQRPPLGLAGGGLAQGVLTSLLSRGRSQDDLAAKVAEDVTELVDWIRDFGVSLRPASIMSSSAPSASLVLRFRDRFMRDGRNVLTAIDASEGALCVVAAAVLAAHPDTPPLIAIDNFDQVLNPRLARGLMERFCAWVLANPASRQVVLTTHNPLALDGLDLTDDRVRLFAIDRTNQGATVATRVVLSDRVLAMAKEGWPLSRLWVMGEIGGVPNAL